MARTDLLVCELCPKECKIAEGQSGDCRCRIVVDGELRAASYGLPCAVHIDPIEKKPLFHFLPGTPIFSLAAAGCNLHCKFCQNWTISQVGPQDVRKIKASPKQVMTVAAEKGCRSIAYTYTEPVVFIEYVLDTAALAKEHGLNNVLVTAGYINRKPLELLCESVDAANTDLKAFSDRFYRDLCGGSLKPVLDGLTVMKERGVWVEVTNLIIPTFNDDMTMIRDMCRWIVAHLGDETPVHFSRFRPMYKIRNLPPTPTDTLMNAQKEAHDIGLKHVYVGNVMGSGAENTVCPNDGTLLIKRLGFSVLENNLKDGTCPTCGKAIAGVWSTG